MRVSSLPLLIAGAGLASLQANATPLRVVVVAHNQEVSTTTSAEAGNGGAAVTQIFRPIAHNEQEAGPLMIKKPCHKSKAGNSQESMREKALKMSNAFRHALGLPQIENADDVMEGGEVHGGLIHIMAPGPFMGALPPPPFPIEGTVGHAPNGDEFIVPARPQHHHKFHHHKLGHRGPFLHRIHRALMALGPWEGRAVAFVLGCGIGVLLRMLFVFAVVTYRAIRGEEEEEATTGYIVFEETTDNSEAAPPPEYQYTDEKEQAESLVGSA